MKKRSIRAMVAEVLIMGDSFFYGVQALHLRDSGKPASTLIVRGLLIISGQRFVPALGFVVYCKTADQQSIIEPGRS
jgi:hypothetical protein